VLHIDLEIGHSIQIDGYTVTVLDVQNDEIFFQVDDDDHQSTSDETLQVTAAPQA